MTESLLRINKLVPLLAFIFVLTSSVGCVSVSFGDDEIAGGETSDQITRSFDTSSAPTINVSGFNGRIVINATEQSSVSIEANLQRPEPVSFDATIEGDVVTVSASQIGTGLYIGSNPSVQMNLNVPPASKIDARTSNGSISISGDLSEGSENSLKSSNGSITVSFESEPDVAIDAKISNGVVSADIPILTTLMERTRLVGEYGDGSASLKAVISNGNVTFE
jgi:hypothetical protein